MPQTYKILAWSLISFFVGTTTNTTNTGTTGDGTGSGDGSAESGGHSGRSGRGSSMYKSPILTEELLFVHNRGMKCAEFLF